MAWTLDQERAIATRGGKIIVSAAAGSGKTAVLSERVLKFVLDGNDINRLLIVTFTEAASLEMKLRIKKKIEEEVIKNEENKHLLKQLTLIDNAKITTMDAFYSDIVKQNFEKLNIMPDFNILSSAEEKLIKNKVIKDVFSDYINDDSFIDLLHVFNASDNNLIKDKIILLADFLDTQGFKNEYIKEVINKYDNNYYKIELINDIKERFSDYLSIYVKIKDELLSFSDFEKLRLNIDEEINIINKILSVNNFDDLSNALRLSSFSNQAPIRGHNDDYLFNKYKQIRKKLKDEVNAKLDDLKYITEKDADNEAITITKSLKKLFEVTLDYQERLLDEKKKINKYSFSDIPLFVIDLLSKNGKKTDLAKKIADLYDEILIDEYQDTNKLQSIIFSLISKDNSNIFVVGDIKQSIYRFRSACPDIFNSDKKNAFKDKFPMLITLSKNFRSRNIVLDFCNFIFENLMSEKLGEVSYNDDEKLYVGASYPENKDAICEIDIINEDEKDEDKELTKRQKEAIYVADKIKNLLDSKYQVYDKKGFFRDVKESDIVILLRNLTNAENYKYALENKNINVYLNKDLEYFDDISVKLVIALLKIVSNPYDDISLMTVLMSELFDLKEEDIINVKIGNKYDYLYDAIRKSSNINLNNILDKIDELNNYAKENSLIDSIYYIYNNLNVIDKIGVDKQSIKNLNTMIKNAKDFDAKCAKSLNEFTCYIDDILNDSSSFKGGVPLSSGSNVTITTIHKSKGLEYPIVFLCDTASKFNKEDYTKSFLIDENFGISFDLFDYDKKYKYEPISNIVLKRKIKNMQLSEELRVLYVALTRAKEKIIITGYINKVEDKLLDASYLVGDEKLISNIYLDTCDSYLKWIIGCLIRHKNSSFKDYNLDNKTFNHEALFKVNVIDANDIKDEVLEEKKEENIGIKEEIIKDYDTNNLPVYLSVSDIKVKDHKYIKKPYFLTSDKKSTNIGTLYHKLLEVLPVKKYSILSLKEELNNLKEENIITEDELKIIDIEKIFAFLTSDIYDLMLKAGIIYKEKEITFKVDASYYDNNLTGEILTSGVIDLLFIYDDTYYIVDYKTDKVSSMEELKDLYKIQLDLYEVGLKQNMNVKKIKKYIYSIALNKFIEV